MSAPPLAGEARLAELVARVEQQDEKIRRLDATIRALARLPADAPPPPVADGAADTTPLASAPTPRPVSWVFRAAQQPAPVPPGGPPPTPDAALPPAAMFRVAADLAADALVGLDPDGAVRVWNPAAARLFGWSAEEVVGGPPPFVPADRADEHAGMIRAAKAVGAGRLIATTRRRKDGGLVPVRATAAPSPCGGVVFTFRPAPETTVDPDPLPSPAPAPTPDDLPELAARPFVTLGRAVAGVVHDFNNLLAVIQGHVELLAEKCPTADPRREAVDGIAVATSVAAGATRELLSLAYPVRGLPPRTDVGLTVCRLERLVRAAVGSRVRVAVVSGGNAGSARVDPSELAQVVLNLALNARDAMPAGGTLTIRAAGHAVGPDRPGWPPGVSAGEFVVLSVADTGQGMDATTRARLFDPFFTTKPPGRGTGLGLMTVRDIVARAGGHVEVESSPGWGTQVRVYLPRG